jgi:fatty-acyl-CoA synthase
VSRPERHPAGGLGSRLREVADAHPDRVAIVDRDGARTTYRDLFAHASRIAHCLTEAGLERGDRVAAWMDDGSPYVELYLAAALAGLTVVPLNSRHTVHEVRCLLEDSEPRAFVWSSARDGQVEELEMSGLVPPVRLRDGETPPCLDALDWARVTATGADRYADRADPDDLLVIGYTSGTTGRPKGALLTHRSVEAVTRQHATAYRLAPHSTIAMTGSMSFVSVVPAHVLTHLAVAGTVVFLGHWDVSSLLDGIKRHRATFTYLPSPVLADFATQAARDPRGWASLRSVLHSASKATAEDLERLVGVIGTRLVEGWGMTENSGGLMTATTVADLEAGPSAAITTVGRALPGYGVRVVEDELQVRGPGVAAGYWRRPDATAAAFRDGWFATGDVGTVDERGYVTLLERRTDLIVSGGMNVYPAEVEAVIAGVPGVAEVAVVGTPHPRWGQAVVAVVVPVAGAVLDVDAIRERCRERLAGYKKPTEILLDVALPRTVSMKVSRAAVRASVLERLTTRA